MKLLLHHFQQQLLQKENLRLQKELDKKQTELGVQDKNVQELKQQLQVMRLNAGGMGEKEKKELEKQINKYLKEIDRCIAMLGA